MDSKRTGKFQAVKQKENLIVISPFYARDGWRTTVSAQKKQLEAKYLVARQGNIGVEMGKLKLDCSRPDQKTKLRCKLCSRAIKVQSKSTSRRNSFLKS